MTTKIKTNNIDSATLASRSASGGGGIKLTSITYPVGVLAGSPSGGETIAVTGSGFANGANVFINTTRCNTTFVNTTSLTFTTVSVSAGSYNLFVYNTDGGFGMKPNGISFSLAPTWTTESGSIGSAGTGATGLSFSVAATSSTAVTYSVKAGSSLPTGLSLNSSTGAITGSVPSVGSLTVYNFTLTATNANGQGTDRAFSITVVVSLESLDFAMVAGGAAGSYSGNIAGAGGGAGGLVTGSMNVTSSVTYTVTIGAGGAPLNNGSNTVISGSGLVTKTAIGGGTGGYYNGAYINAFNGGSGGGAAWNGANHTTYGNALQPTSATGGFGNRGGIGDTGSGAYATAGGGGGATANGVDSVVNSNAGGLGGSGKLLTITAAFAGTANIASSNVLTISAATTGEIQVGTQVTGTGIPAGAYITALGTGTGGLGTYTMNVAATATTTGVSITSSGRYLAGGGGGTTYNSIPAYYGYGGAGGGGNGGADGRIIALNPTAGATNTGGGGGGRGYSAAGESGAGGSGVVLLSYPSAYPAATSTTGSPSVLVSGGLRVYKFTSSGSITF
jgi:hypothetical protein